MNYLLTSHLILTFATFGLGLLVFCNYHKGLLYSKVGSFLALINIGSAITGLFLNPTLRSPFVWLAIITLTTIPNGLRMFHKGSRGEFKRSMLFSWLGLCVALVGAFFPERRLGYMFWSKLKVPETIANNYSIGLVILTSCVALVLVTLVLQKKILKD